MSLERISVNETMLELRRIKARRSDAPTLVFLHEGLGCARMWRDFPERLAELTGCAAIVYSRAGYGGSDPCKLPRPLDYMEQEGVDVLPELLRVAEIEDYILIGHSDGGSIALVYAGATPAAGLRGIITEAAHVFCEPISVSSIARAREEFVNGDLREKLWRYHAENTDCAFWGWNDAWLNPDFINWNIEEYLPGIEVPLMALQGVDDEYGTALQVDAIVKKAGKGAAAVMVDGCGHWPHRDQTDTVLSEMARFIERLLR